MKRIEAAFEPSEPTDQLMSQKPKSHESSDQRGKLRIGNDWNAITIIALSQSNPLKAIAELVENSIDARATNVTIIRGRSEGRHYLGLLSFWTWARN